MTGRTLRCGSSSGRMDIELHWRKQARLVEVRPGKWVGPCPKDGERAALNVTVGSNGAVIWNVPGCKSTHDRAAAYPALKTLVPCAPEPGQERNPELEALKATITRLVTNKAFAPAAKSLAILEALGYGTDEALDMLGITDTGNRRRTRVARDKALSRARTVKTDSKPRSRAPESKPDTTQADLPTPTPMLPPAETHLPAATVKTDSGQAVTDSRPKSPKTPLTSAFPSLTDRANVVSGPAGRIRDTNTALDLDLAIEALNANLDAKAIKAWTPVEEGPCTRCGARTCRYGDRGSPLCAHCRTPAEVRRPA